MWFNSIITLLLSSCFVVYLLLKWKYSYWRRKGIPYLSTNIPLEICKTGHHSGYIFQKQYEILKSQGHKHGGFHIFARPVYMITDLEYIKNVMSKDFQYFNERGIYYNEEADPMSAHLINLEGVKWKDLRAKLTPTFTSGKMKMMFQSILDCGTQLAEAMDAYCKLKQPADIKDVSGRFTTDVIGSCAFGLACNSFTNPSNEFRTNGKQIFNQTKWHMLKYFISFALPTLSKRLGLILAGIKEKHFFRDITYSTIKYREKNNVQRNDFINLLMNLRKPNSTNGIGLTMEEIAAQSYLFFLAGFESSSTTVSFCLYELANNQGIQSKVQEEVRKVSAQHNNKITYESVAEMKYLRQVIDETLRKYPPLYMTRLCVKDYTIPDTDIILDRGTCILIPFYALHHDPEYFPDPYQFDPDRFSAENKEKIPTFAYLPFGEGPRNCMGIRFGLMQTEICIAILMRNFTFKISSKTKMPIKFHVIGMFPVSQNTIWLDVEENDDSKELGL